MPSPMILDCITKRQSIRRYFNTPLAREHLLQCIEAARLAPSACNMQPWKFIIVDDVDLKNRLCQEAFGGVYAINRFAASAPVIVAVISEKEKFLTALAGRVRGTKYYLLDIGISCEHFILQAAELGIGSCWIGWFDEKKVKELLKVPHSEKVDVLISLGYYQEVQRSQKIRKPQKEIVSFNRYK